MMRRRAFIGMGMTSVGAALSGLEILSQPRLPSLEGWSFGAIADYLRAISGDGKAQYLLSCRFDV